MVGSQSVTDLSTLIKKTKGQVPPSLVGCSITNLGDKIYLFGGRLSTTKQMTNHLYIMDLHSLVWHRHISSPDSAHPPCPRYFHSATVYRHFIVYFGGMNYGTDLSKTIDTKRNTLMDDYERKANVYTLNDIHLFNTRNLTWTKHRTAPSLFTPKPRYAHIAIITATAKDRLVIMGGQDSNNDYVDEYNVLDLITFEWDHGGSLDRTCSIYRTVPFDPRIGIEKFRGLPHSLDQQPSNDSHSDFYIFANHNLSSDEISRELTSFDPTRSGAFKDYSHLLSQQPLEQHILPALRFPHGQVIGQHLVIAGTYLGSHSISYQIWALHLGTMAWSRIDTGSKLLKGAWGRGLGYNDHWLVFGNRNDDGYKTYGQREIKFDDIMTIHLEAYGVYTTPISTCDKLGYDLGLTMLNESNMADVYVVTSDDRSIPANLSILSLRWPLVSKLITGKSNGSVNKSGESNNNNPTAIDDEEIVLGGRQRHQKGIGKSLLFPETYTVALAFLQYIYTDHLMTVQQHQPIVLARLLILSDMYSMHRLKQLSLHALHQILSVSTASLVYETATLTNQFGLQVRALRLMISAKKSMQRQQDASLSSPVSPPSATNTLDFLAYPPPSIPPPPTPTSSDAYSIASSTFLSDSQHDDFFTFSTPSPASSPTTTTHKYYYPHLVPVTSHHHDNKNDGATVYLVSKKSSSHSLSSGSSTTSSNDTHNIYHIQQQSSMKTSQFSKGQNNTTTTNGNGKFSWRRLQQSTIALAKPKPLRIDASNAQPFYDL